MRAGIQLNELLQSPRGRREQRPIRMVRPDERQLLLRHLDGDADAFAELVAEYRAPVYSYLARCGVEREERDDLFQEVFIKIHRGAASYDPERPLHPWVFTIVSNTVRTHVRKRRVRQLIFGGPGGEDAEDPTPDGERRTAARETAAFVQRKLSGLRLVQRQVVLLACVEKMPLKDVAEVLSIPVNTVKTHLRRARLALADALAREQRRGGARPDNRREKGAPATELKKEVTT